MRFSLPFRCGWLLGLALLVPVGCSGPPPVTVTGKVTRDGKPVTLSPGQSLRVIFFQQVEGGKNPVIRRTNTEPDGSFTLTQVPVGKYRVAVEQLDKSRQDVLEGAFSGDKAFTVEVDGKKPVDLDLAKPAG